eukprot:3929144-Alexandrium_andersonii.AAC.1
MSKCASCRKLCNCPRLRTVVCSGPVTRRPVGGASEGAPASLSGGGPPLRTGPLRYGGVVGTPI